MKREEALEIYKERASKFASTRSILWKVNLAVWTALALTIQFKKQIELSIDSTIPLGVVLTIIHFAFTLLIQLSLESDKHVMTDIVEKLNVNTDKDLNVAVDVKANPEKYRWTFYVWIILQIAITFFLLYILWKLPAPQDL